jgi:type VI secretion system protein ImpG
MKRLLPYYERELAALHDLSREFAEQYPALAGHLGMSNGGIDDPSIGQLVQAIALLNARTAMRLDDGHAEFTEAMLQVNAPHSLQPFPSSAIARFDTAGGAEAGGEPLIHRGAILNSVESQGVVCRFRTVFDVAPVPVAVMDATFHPSIEMPLSMGRPADVTSSIRIELASLAPSLGLAELAQGQGGTLRLFLDGDPVLCAALRDTLLLRALHAYVQADGDEQWWPLAHMPLREAGFEAQEAMLPQRANMQPSWRLLTEYFAYPDKFNFIDIDLGAIAGGLPAGCRRAVLHLALGGIRHDDDLVQLLRPLSAVNFLSNCTPVINLFPQAAIPIECDHAEPDYALVPSPDHAHAYDIHSIDAVQMLRQSARQDALTDFYPYYSLCHGTAGGKLGHYWLLRRDEVMACTHPGHEYRIALVDLEKNPLALEAATVSVTLTCSNRYLPHDLPWGRPEGDLSPDSAEHTYPVRLLRRPSLPCRYPATAHWSLIAQLSLNLRALLEGGLPALKEMLLLHNMRGSPVAQRMIAGIRSWSHKRARHWLAHPEGGSHVYGVEVSIEVDLLAFAGVSLHAFIRVLDCFLGQHAPLNSFTRLVVLDQASGKELLRCQARSGDTVLP